MGQITYLSIVTESIMLKFMTITFLRNKFCGGV